MTNWPSITRDQVIANAKKGFGGGLNKVPYSQKDFSGNYRADCSGFVCRALGLSKADAEAHGVDWWGGMNTVTLATSGALQPIGINDLQRGDLAGELGPGTGGDGGHVYVFDEWFNQDPDDSRMWIYEQCGGTRGPIRSLRTWPYPGTCHAYRYAGITDNAHGGSSTSGDDDMPTFSSYSLGKAQALSWEKNTTLAWGKENADPLKAHADGSYPGYIPPKSGYADFDVSLHLSGLQAPSAGSPDVVPDYVQVSVTAYGWKGGTAVNGSKELLYDGPASTGDSYLRVRGLKYIAAGQHVYVGVAVYSSGGAGRPAPKAASGTWRIAQY